MNESWFTKKKKLLTPLGKSFLIPLRLTAATDATVQKSKKKYESEMTQMTISNDEMKDIMKIGKSLVESDLVIKGVCETIQAFIRYISC